MQPAQTILVIDDEPTVRLVSARALQSFGFKTIEAPDGSAGIETYRAHQADVVAVLLDLTMPGPSGTETLRALRAINPAVRVILMSGFSEPDYQPGPPEDQPSAFLPKPFELGTLREKVFAVLESSSP